MAWQLENPEFRAAVLELVERMGGRCLLVGTVGAQIHLAAAIGIDKRGPPAHAIDVVPLEGAAVPDRIGGVPVREASTHGFDASVAAGRCEVELGGSRFPVAAPEHVLGMTLADDRLGMEGKWACFALMRALEGRELDLEAVRGFIKRCASPERETLLHELAYLAA